MAKYIVEKQNDDDVLIWHINRRTKKGYYKILPTSSQFEYCERIDFEGFNRLPSGFYSRGFGLTAGGPRLLREISNKYEKKVRLRIAEKESSHLDARGKYVVATVSHTELSLLNTSVRSIKSQRNEEIQTIVQSFLGQHFRQFRQYKGLAPRYAPGVMAEVLNQKDLLKRLSTEDRQNLENFIPDYLSSVSGTLRAKKRLQVINDSLDAGKKIYLTKILTEFKKKLSRKVQNEATWQRFLSDYILILRNTYGEVLEKESVSLQGKYPDFMLIDPYSYLDIYEIKRPSTCLLGFDQSRKNYYWSIELSKAISQVENYLHQVQRNSDTLINDIRRSKSIEVSIVRPRGYIIAGTRSQLNGQKMIDDYRILNESLKNIDIILYDDLLQNLETFLERTKPDNS